jgi:predicted transcriptional regulator of viral defense system
METITKEKFIKIFREKSIALFTLEDVFKLFKIQPLAAKALLQRLKKGKIIQPLIRGKYLFLFAPRSSEEFEIANFLHQPSYVSLESALSFYGLIDQFPYQVFSITLGKTKSFQVQEKNFVYTHIKPEFFKDYKKEGNFLIATPEKSVFDFLYLVYKGARTKNSLKLLNLKRANLSRVKLEEYIGKLALEKDKNFIKFCKNQEII